MDITKTAPFSGYRPDKLHDLGDESSPSITILKSDPHEAIVEAF